MLDAVMTTGTAPRPIDTRKRAATPARTGWWIPVTALVAWLVYRQADSTSVQIIALVGAALFLAVFGFSAARASAQRWWGGSRRPV